MELARGNPSLFLCLKKYTDIQNPNTIESPQNSFINKEKIMIRVYTHVGEVKRVQLARLVEMTFAINNQIDPNWLTAANKWYRGAHAEAAEIIDGEDWKWWRKGEKRNRFQQVLEVADIWHFFISDYIATQNKFTPGITNEEVTDRLFRDFAVSNVLAGDGRDEIDPIDAAEEFIIHILEYKGLTSVTLLPFTNLMKSFNVSFDELFGVLVKKFALNVFRQDNGYNKGTYIKMWHGKEDNHYLEGLPTAPDCVEMLETYIDSIHMSLSTLYKGVINKA